MAEITNLSFMYKWDFFFLEDIWFLGKVCVFYSKSVLMHWTLGREWMMLKSSILPEDWAADIYF